MKIKTLITFVALLLSSSFLKSQTSINWQPAAISIDGTNGFQGVDVYYYLTTCNSNDVVILKLINRNPYDVKAQWKSVLVGNNDKELFGKSKLVSLKLSAKSEVEGSCKGKEAVLIVKLSDYGLKASDFRIFAGSAFDVIK